MSEVGRLQEGVGLFEAECERKKDNSSG